MRLNKNLIVEHISSRYLGRKNFSGDPGRYNEAGKRNFNLYLDDPNANYSYGGEHFDSNDPSEVERLAETLRNDGWNVKFIPANEERGYEGHFYVKVNINANAQNNNVPRTRYINHNNNAIDIPEEALPEFLNKIGRGDQTIDWMNISISPYNYDWREGGNNQTAYVSVMYFKFVENDIWADEY